MAPNPSPAFQFYVKDWRSSRRVVAMSFATRGMYLEMLCEQWEAGAVPATPSACADRLGGTLAEWTRAWPKLLPCFVQRKRDGLLVNAKLDGLRRERDRYRKGQIANGKRGAAVTWKNRGKPMGSPSLAQGKPVATAPPHSGRAHGSSSSTSSSSSSSSSRRRRPDLLGPDLLSEAAPPPPSDGKKRPIFKGQRLAVFEWQVDDLTRMLGPLADQFDLHAWFVTLDATVVNAAVVMPERDGGAWLKAQTLAEAQRRGLPIAVSPVAIAGKQTTRLLSAVASIEREAQG